MGKATSKLKSLLGDHSSAVVYGIIYTIIGVTVLVRFGAALHEQIALLDQSHKKDAEQIKGELESRAKLLDSERRAGDKENEILHEKLDKRLDASFRLNNDDHADIKGRLEHNYQDNRSLIRDLGIKMDRILERLPPAPAMTRRPEGTAADAPQ